MAAISYAITHHASIHELTADQWDADQWDALPSQAWAGILAREQW
jgi:hypothetical protein